MADADSNGSRTPLRLPPPPPERQELTPQILNPVTLSQVMPDRGKTILRSRFFDGPNFGLPHKWLIEHRPRTSPRYLGRVDQFFYEPDTGKQFRSLSAVEKHLGRQLPAKRELKYLKKQSPRLFVAPARPRPGDSPATHIQVDDGDDHAEPEITTTSENSRSLIKTLREKKRRTTNYSIEFGNPPDSVTWALSDAANDIWIPHISGIRISDEEKDSWAETFMAINSAKNYAP